MSEREDVYGYVVESPTSRISIIASNHPLPVGEYVELPFNIYDRSSGSISTRKALAVVSEASYRHAVPHSIMSYLNPSITGPQSIKVSFTRLYVIAEVSDTGVAEPRYPIPPDTPVKPASQGILEKVYGGSSEGVKIGSLAPRRLEIDIRVNPDKLAKHLLIAGATGSGKSNTVAVLADRLSAIGAPVIIFDVHGEYEIQPEDGDTNRVRVVEAKINPLKIPPRILSTIIITEPQASSQRRLLAKALSTLMNEVKEISAREKISEETAIQELVSKKIKLEVEEGLGNKEALLVKGLGELIKHKVVSEAGGSRDARVVDKVREKVDEFFEITPLTLTEELPTYHISYSRMLVVDASGLGDEQRRWVLKVIVDDLLEKLKSRELESAVLVVEEAPLFMGVEVGHPVKYSLQKFAREGRKFGGSLIVVSQRPRSLDVNVVSQLQNFVFLRMVQYEDIKAVMNIADNLDETLANIIPSLPDGRAIVMGEWLGRFPAMVDIDLHRGKRVGATPPLRDIWLRQKERIENSERLKGFSLEP